MCGCATQTLWNSYAQGAYRLSALSHMGVIYIMTHDSIGLGPLASRAPMHPARSRRPVRPFLVLHAVAVAM